MKFNPHGEKLTKGYTFYRIDLSGRRKTKAKGHDQQI
jgi:hypothetical protein